MKQLLTLCIVALALGFIAPIAHAQFTNVFYIYTGDTNLEGDIGYYEQSPQFGYTVYGWPIPPYFILFSDTKYWRWTSTCPSGGAYAEINQMNPSMTQVSNGASIVNPFNASYVQGLYSSAEIIQWTGFSNQPVLTRVFSEGFPCGPTGLGALQSQNQEGLTETQ